MTDMAEDLQPPAWNDLIDESPQVIETASDLSALPIPKKFEKYTFVKTVEDDGGVDVRGQLHDRATRFLAFFIDRGRVSSEEAAQVGKLWSEAVVLDQRGMDYLAVFDKSPYLDMIEDLEGQKGELEPTDPESREVLEKVDDLINTAHQRMRMIDSKMKGLAVMTRVSPFDRDDPTVKALQMPDHWLVLNRDKLRTELEKNPAIIDVVACEETSHMISKLQDYPGELGSTAWVEEMMARINALNVGGGHLGSEKVDDIRQLLRADDYEKLFVTMLSRSEVGPEVMVDAYFGKLPKDSPDVAKLNEAIGEIDLIGQFIDMGLSFDAIRSHFERASGS